MRMLSERDVTQLLSTAESVGLLEHALRMQSEGQAENIPRRRPRTEAYVLHVLPAASVGPHLGTKLYMSGGSAVKFIYLLFGVDGLEAMIAADQLGRMRTGAASGLATKYLAAPDASRLVIFGAGNQATTQVEAVMAVRPITHVAICSRSHDRAQCFADSLRKRTKATIEVSLDIPATVAAADIISTMTSSSDPVFNGSDLPKNVHINAAGSNRRSNREIDAETIHRAHMIVVDDIAQAHEEAGDFLLNPDADWARARPLTEIFSCPQPPPGGVTLFESLGIGLWDLALAVELVDRARSRGVGHEIDLTDFFASVSP